MANMLTCHLQLKMKSKSEFPFLIDRLFLNIKHLPLLSTVNLFLDEFMHILIALYHVPINLALFPHSLIDASEYAQVGINYKTG